jgi:hypothetical protein
MSYANDITGKLEDACVAMLQAAVTAGTITLVASDSILPGIDNGDVPLPRVVCVSDDARVEEIFDGNWDADLSIKIIASSEDTDRQGFRDICGEIFAHFFLDRDAVRVALSNADIQFTAHEVYPREQMKSFVSGQDGNEWNAELRLSVKCCGSVIAD